VPELSVGRISKALTLAVALAVAALFGPASAKWAAAAGVGEGLSSPFELYLGPGFALPGTGAVGWGVSGPFDVYLGPGFTPGAGGAVGSALSTPFAVFLGPGFEPPDGGSIGSAVSPAFSIYLGPSFEPPNEAGTGYAMSTAFDLYLGLRREGFGVSTFFELDTRTPDPSFVSAPTNLSALIGACGTTVQIQWNYDASDNTGFQIEAKIAGFPDIWYQQLTPITATARSFHHQPNDGLARTYRLRAVRGQAVSAYSNVVSPPAPGLPGYARPSAGLTVKSIGDGAGLRVHISPPQGTTQWDGVSVVQVDQASSENFDQDIVTTRRVVFEGSGERTLRFEGVRDNPAYFRAQLIPPCTQPSSFVYSAGVAPRYAPVLLVHGIWGSPSSWSQVWSDVLAGAGYGADRIRRATFRYCGDTWMAWGEELRTSIMPKLLNDGEVWSHDESVDIIAHSQGGLAARYYVEWRGGVPNVRTVVMIATPNHGGRFATFSSFLHNAGLTLPVCKAFSNSVGVRALGSNSTPLRTINFGNDKQHDGGCEDLPAEQVAAKKGSVEYYTIAGTGPSVFYCHPLNPISLYCQWKEIRDEDPGTCASDGVVKAKSVYLRALSADHQFRDVDIGAGGTVHSGGLEVPLYSKPILDSEEIAEWAVGLLRRPNAHDSAVEGIPATAAAVVSLTGTEEFPPRRERMEGVLSSSSGPDSLTLLASVTDSIPGGGVRSYSAAGDTVGQLMVFGAWQDSILSLRLRGPDSTFYAPADTLGRPWLQYERNDVLGYAAFAVDSPTVGTWAVEVSAPPGAYMAHFDVEWVASGGGFRLSAALDKDVLQPGDTLTLSASLLNRGTPVGADCSASVLSPMGTSDFLALHDDGSAPDSLPGDGIYTARFIAPLTDGGYQVRVAGHAIGEGFSPIQRSSVMAFSVIAGPDLELAPDAMRAAPAVSSVGRLTELSLTIHNRGFTTSDSTRVSFEDASTGEPLAVSTVRVPAKDSVETRILWTPQVGGEHLVRASATLLGSVEGNVSNNSVELVVPIAAILPAVGVDTTRVIPARVEFAPPRPNPFRGSVNFDFALPRAARVSIEVFDVQGRRLRRVLDQLLTAGRHTRSWKGDDATGHKVFSGVYFVRFTAPGYVLTRRVVLMR
jgi:hypothetical protein